MKVQIRDKISHQITPTDPIKSGFPVLSRLRSRDFDPSRGIFLGFVYLETKKVYKDLARDLLLSALVKTGVFLQTYAGKEAC